MMGFCGKRKSLKNSLFEIKEYRLYIGKFPIFMKPENVKPDY